VIAFDGVRRTALTEDKVIATVLRRCPERQPSERVGAAPCLAYTACTRCSTKGTPTLSRPCQLPFAAAPMSAAPLRATGRTEGAMRSSTLRKAALAGWPFHCPVCNSGAPRGRGSSVPWRPTRARPAAPIWVSGELANHSFRRLASAERVEALSAAGAPSERQVTTSAGGAGPCCNATVTLDRRTANSSPI